MFDYRLDLPIISITDIVGPGFSNFLLEMCEKNVCVNISILRTMSSQLCWAWPRGNIFLGFIVWDVNINRKYWCDQIFYKNGFQVVICLDFLAKNFVYDVLWPARVSRRDNIKYCTRWPFNADIFGEFHNTKPKPF